MLISIASLNVSSLGFVLGKIGLCGLCGTMRLGASRSKRSKILHQYTRPQRIASAILTTISVCAPALAESNSDPFYPCMRHRSVDQEKRVLHCLCTPPSKFVFVLKVFASCVVFTMNDFNSTALLVDIAIRQRV